MACIGEDMSPTNLIVVDFQKGKIGKVHLRGLKVCLILKKSV